MTRRPNSGSSTTRKASAVQLFVQRYARKTRPGGLDPNDRNYDRGMEGAIRRMKPEQLDALLREGEPE